MRHVFSLLLCLHSILRSTSSALKINYLCLTNIDIYFTFFLNSNRVFVWRCSPITVPDVRVTSSANMTMNFSVVSGCNWITFVVCSTNRSYSSFINRENKCALKEALSYTNGIVNMSLIPSFIWPYIILYFFKGVIPVSFRS